MTKTKPSPWLTSEYWQNRFLSSDTPWELGHPSVVLLEAFEELATRGEPIRDKKILSAGCGTGRDALALAQRGAHVLAIDWSSHAIVDLQERSRNLPLIGGSVAIESGDFFAIEPRPMDVVAEHTFFCAIDPITRSRYVDRISEWISPGGYLVGNFFVLADAEASALSGLSLSAAREGPPFATTVSELQRRLSPYFEEIVLRPATHGEPDRRPGMEWVGVFRRR